MYLKIVQFHGQVKYSALRIMRYENHRFEAEKHKPVIIFLQNITNNNSIYVLYRR